MAKRIRHLILTSLLLCCVQAGLSATQTPGVPTPSIALDFSVFGPSAIKGLCYQSEVDDKTFQPLRFYNNYRSPSYHYQGQRTLKIYNQEAVTTAQAKAKAAGTKSPVTLPDPVAIVAIPENVGRALLLFFPTPDARGSSPRFNVFVLNDSTTNVPANHTVIINASRHEWVARVNGQQLLITRGVLAPVKVIDEKATLQLTHTEARFQNILLADEWHSDPSQRNLIILFPPHSANDLLPKMVRLLDKVPDSPTGITVAKR